MIIIDKPQHFVVPAQAGIQRLLRTTLDSRLRGNDGWPVYFIPAVLK